MCTYKKKRWARVLAYIFEAVEYSLCILFFLVAAELWPLASPSGNNCWSNQNDSNESRVYSIYEKNVNIFTVIFIVNNSQWNACCWLKTRSFFEELSNTTEFYSRLWQTVFPSLHSWAVTLHLKLKEPKIPKDEKFISSQNISGPLLFGPYMVTLRFSAPVCQICATSWPQHCHMSARRRQKYRAGPNIWHPEYSLPEAQHIWQ